MQFLLHVSFSVHSWNTIPMKSVVADCKMSTSSRLSLVFGSGRSAEQMARMLCLGGNRVTVVGARPSSESNIRTQLKKDVESTIPFQYLDDLKNQQDLFESRISRITFQPDIKKIEGEVEFIVDATGNDNEMLSQIRSRFPHAPVASLSGKDTADPFFVGVHIFEPMEVTKIAEIHSSSKTDKSVLDKVRSIFHKAGITEISPTEAVRATEIISDWQRTADPIDCLQSEVQNLLSSHDTDESAKSHTVMH